MLNQTPAHNIVQPVVADQKAIDANRDPDSNFFFIADPDLHPNLHPNPKLTDAKLINVYIYDRSKIFLTFLSIKKENINR
jgi:hypothetical protein